MKKLILLILFPLTFSFNFLLNAHIISDEEAPFHNDVTDRVREFSHDGTDFNIFYTTDSSSLHRVTVSDIDTLQGYIIDSYDGLVKIMGFRPPWQSILPNYDFVVKDDWWYAKHDHLVLHSSGGAGSENPNSGIRDNSDLQNGVITLHELFHNVQRNYMNSIVDYAGDDGRSIGALWMVV